MPSTDMQSWATLVFLLTRVFSDATKRVHVLDRIESNLPEAQRLQLDIFNLRR